MKTILTLFLVAAAVIGNAQAARKSANQYSGPIRITKPIRFTGLDTDRCMTCPVMLVDDTSKFVHGGGTIVPAPKGGKELSFHGSGVSSVDTTKYRRITIENMPTTGGGTYIPLTLDQVRNRFKPNPDDFTIRLFDGFYPINVQDGKIQIGNSKFYQIESNDTTYAIENNKPVQLLRYVFTCHKESWEEDLKLRFNGNDWVLISFEVKKPVPDVVYFPGKVEQIWPEYFHPASR